VEGCNCVIYFLVYEVLVFLRRMNEEGSKFFNVRVFVSDRAISSHVDVESSTSSMNCRISVPNKTVLSLSRSDNWYQGFIGVFRRHR